MREDALPVRVGVVADDLTGSGDAAGGFAGRGVATVGVLAPASAEAVPDAARVLVWNAESRTLVPERAAEAFGRAVDAVRRAGWPVLYKKIDSQLRGHVGGELAAALRLGLWRSIILAPANPTAGRTTVGGVQHVVDVSSDADARHVRIADRVGGELAGHLDHVSLADLRSDGRSVARRLQASGRVVVVDAETLDDLRRIVGLADPFSGRTLLCGAAGLSEALGWGLTGQRLTRLAPPDPVDAPVAVVAGSASEVTHRQLRVLAKSRPVTWSIVGPTDADLAPAADRLVGAARGGADVAASTPPSDLPGMGSRLVDALGRTARRLADEAGVRRWVVVGGQTASGVLAGLGVEAMRYTGELVSGIVVGKGLGRGAGHVIATKPGAFGGASALAKAVDWLRGRTGPTSKA